MDSYVEVKKFKRNVRQSAK
ncbi:hypothetical protein ROI_05330 [Roseburia intestinalis M50/1]|nr:hypothetical protein ROI_05330 [Roseburia intestinalis M50/1]